MPKMNKTFWNERVKKNQHTGWTNSHIYLYDQKLRLKVIGKMASKNIDKYSRVLDFGCGVGDFSSMLSIKSKKVYAYDIADKAIDIAKKNNAKDNIEFIFGDLNNLDKKILDNELDLILVVTVLDHVLNEDIVDVVKLFDKKLHKNGKIICLEYALDPLSYQLKKSEYQMFRKLNEYITIFSDQNLTLQDCYGFYHPIYNKDSNYIIYHFIESFLFINEKSINYIAEILSSHAAAKIILDPCGYVMKLMIFKKKYNI